MSQCLERQDFPSDKFMWSLLIEFLSLEKEDEEDDRILEGQTFPRLLSCFCRQTLKYPYKTVRFPEELCLIVNIFYFIAGMSKQNNRFRFKSDDFFKNTGKNTERKRHIANSSPVC